MTTRKLPNIIVTGTPGVGKTSHCEVLAESTGMRYLNISRIVKERQLYESWDERLLSWNVDELRVCGMEVGWIIASDNRSVLAAAVDPR